MSRTEQDIDLKSSILESSCEKLSKHLSGVEPDIESSFTKIPCEELIEEKLLFRVESDIDINSSFIETICEEFPEEKLDIQKIRSPHKAKKHENINKNENVP